MGKREKTKKRLANYEKECKAADKHAGNGECARKAIHVEKCMTETNGEKSKLSLPNCWAQAHFIECRRKHPLDPGLCNKAAERNNQVKELQEIKEAAKECVSEKKGNADACWRMAEETKKRLANYEKDCKAADKNAGNGECARKAKHVEKCMTETNGEKSKLSLPNCWRKA